MQTIRCFPCICPLTFCCLPSAAKPAFALASVLVSITLGAAAVYTYWYHSCWLLPKPSMVHFRKPFCLRWWVTRQSNTLSRFWLGCSHPFAIRIDVLHCSTNTRVLQRPDDDVQLALGRKMSTCIVQQCDVDGVENENVALEVRAIDYVTK